MTDKNDEWVGGKQVYGGQQDQPTPDWLDELTADDLGFNTNPVGWKPKNRTVESKEETK